MNKLLILLVTILISSFFLTNFALADYSSTYQSYITLTDLYRKHYQGYISAKNKFLTYHTLTSENEAIENGRNFLKARDQLVVQYLALLREKTAESGGFSQNDRDLIFNKLNVESVWLVQHRMKYDTAASLVDLQRVSDQMQDRYASVIRYVALQTAGSILANKEAAFTTTINDLLYRTQNFLNSMDKDGYDTNLAQRWLLEAQNKVALSQEQQDTALNIFLNLHGQNLINDYNRGVYALTQSNQYLREASSYISEIIRIVKGE